MEEATKKTHAERPTEEKILGNPKISIANVVNISRDHVVVRVRAPMSCNAIAKHRRFVASSPVADRAKYR